MTVTDRWWGSVGVGNPDTAPAHIGVHIDTLRDSIAGYTTALFANVTDRATATADFLAARPDAVGMKGFVAGRGACVYDANVRPGSGGWTWESQEVDLVQAAGLGATASSVTLVDLGTPGTTYTVNHGSPYNRRVRISVGAYMQNYSAAALSAAAGCQVRVSRNSTELTEVRLSQVIMPGTVIAAGASENRAYASWVFTFTGTSIFRVQMLKEGSATGSVQVQLGTFLVTDLGPAD